LDRTDDLTVVPGAETITRRTIAAYDSRASEYADSTWSFDAFPGLRDELAAFDSAAPAGASLLDLGCGAGRDSNHLALRGRHVVAADRSEGLLREARSRLNADTSRRVSMVRLDLKTLPFCADTFGGVWASGSLLHLPDTSFAGALAEVARVLMPGGLAAISMKEGSSRGWRRTARMVPDRWFTLVQPETFADTMRSVGFTAVGIARSGRGDWFIASGCLPT
jgi:ubiquinone/menaquinone biosynthesis C-methylase UbiE